MKKKGALQLSINTIVLLVLAMALLGIIIGSFTGLFNQSRDELFESMLLVDAGAKATSGDVMAGGDAQRIRRNQDQIIAVSYFNTGYTSCEESAQLIVDCDEVDDGMEYFATEIKVPIGQERTLPALINIDRSIPKREYVCTLKVQCQGSDVVADQHAVFSIR